MSSDQEWPVTVFRVDRDEEGRYASLAIEETIGEGTDKLRFPSGWNAFDLWPSYKQEKFKKLLRKGNLISVVFDECLVLLKISDEVSSFTIETPSCIVESKKPVSKEPEPKERGSMTDFEVIVDADWELPPYRPRVPSTTTTTTTTTSTHATRGPSKIIVSQPHPKPITLELTLKSNKSVYTKSIALDMVALLLTHDYLNRLCERCPDETIFSAMITECSKRISL